MEGITIKIDHRLAYSIFRIYENQACCRVTWTRFQFFTIGESINSSQLSLIIVFESWKKIGLAPPIF